MIWILYLPNVLSSIFRKLTFHVPRTTIFSFLLDPKLLGFITQPRYKPFYLNSCPLKSFMVNRQYFVHRWFFKFEFWVYEFSPI